MYDLYRSIMDSNVNPLRNLPPAQRFQAMVVLSVMWTSIFCAATGAWLWYGELVVGHVLAALGVLITGLVFRSASRYVPKRHRDCPLPDGTARYDDIQGA